jgi:predicted RNase H-like HicB family nuclease
MVSRMKKQYTVVFKPIEDGWWLARVPAIPGCLTQGRTIRQARARIREALHLFDVNPARVELQEAFELPVAIQRAIDHCCAARRRAERYVLISKCVGIETAVLLTKDFHLAVRDAGELLGLSHQRVQQLATMAAPEVEPEHPAEAGLGMPMFEFLEFAISAGSTAWSTEGSNVTPGSVETFDERDFDPHVR